MKEIPVEFMPGFWVSIPEGLEGKGSGFLLAENIKSIFSVNCVVPKSQDFQRNWTILDMTENEINNTNYLNAITRIMHNKSNCFIVIFDSIQHGIYVTVG